jgi:CubicO group peptidase (beta-lactamase class C family)
MAFHTSLGEVNGRLELQTSVDRYVRWSPFVNLLGLAMLFTALPAQGQGGGTHITLDQVNQAVRETQRLCEEQIENEAVPGLAIAVVFQDQVVYAAGFGVRDVNSREAVNADTVFQLASLSKAIGSTVVAELVGEGKISWDSRIIDLDPDFAMDDPWVTREITIRDFYVHRSGLPTNTGDALEILGFNREQILHRLRYQKPDSSFRSRWAYTNFGITEAAVAAAKAYKMTWEDASEQKLYRPLGMNSTSSRYADFLRGPTKHLAMYRSMASGSKNTSEIRIRNPRLAASAHRSTISPNGCVCSSRMGNLRANESSMKKRWR